jgi:hypothetical protein
MEEEKCLLAVENKASTSIQASVDSSTITFIANEKLEGKFAEKKNFLIESLFYL